ncbi:hypothetical protein N7454_002264 [Penicillium verhagenii]|nr:hypothetical protein N7454_002264 [Penicillium verhagenii]
MESQPSPGPPFDAQMFLYQFQAEEPEHPEQTPDTGESQETNEKTPGEINEETQPPAPNPTAQLVEAPVQEYYLEPPPQDTFDSRENLLETVRKHSLSKGFATCIAKSRAESIYIGCARGGIPTKNKNLGGISGIPRPGQRTSKRCGCPFQLYARRGKKSDVWKLQIRHSAHNHPPDEHISAHPTARRLSVVQKRQVKHLNAIGVKPKGIVMFLKLEDPSRGMRESLAIARLTSPEQPEGAAPQVMSPRNAVADPL